MATSRDHSLDTLAPTEGDRRLARQLLPRLARLAPRRRKRPVQLRIQPEGEPTESIEVPVPVFHILQRILTEMAQGNGVSILPVRSELTTQQAADFLNVSRPYLIELLEQGRMPYRKVGSHRRIRLQDVLSYKERVDAARQAALAELTSQAEELEMGY